LVNSIIVAGGKGKRMNGEIRKQYLVLAGLPILCHTLKVFDTCKTIDRIFLVIPSDDISYCRQHILSAVQLTKTVHLVPGGDERQASVYNGLLAIGRQIHTPIGPDDTVVIHDGVRPFVTCNQIDDCICNAKANGACILGIPVFDTLKYTDVLGFIDKTIQRDNTWFAQTPQAFQYHIIMARQTGYHGTDDASLVEQIGGQVKILQGSRYNIKITNQEDLDISEAILIARRDTIY
jgi:2-C-methyl-D-erythritol 4-phosphate cytidylyltransferase